MRRALLFLFAAAVYCQEEEPPEFWSTGPLLNYSGYIVELGHVAFQPYLSWFQYRGAYDSDWHFQSDKIFNRFLFQPYLQVGICPRVEIDLFPSIAYNHIDGAGQWVLGDFPIWLSAMLLESDKYNPSILLELFTNFPTGKYKKLKESKLETDIGGIGSWQPGAGLLLYKEFYLWHSHYLALTYFAGYFFNTSVHVKGLNAYGGDETTIGKVHPGDVFDTILTFEYSFTQNWLFSIDADYQHGNKTSFSGETVEPVGSPSYEQFSLAPALEYMWDENSGIIFGSWFTVAGRNADQFNSFIVAVYLYR